MDTFDVAVSSIHHGARPARLDDMDESSSSSNGPLAGASKLAEIELVSLAFGAPTSSPCRCTFTRPIQFRRRAPEISTPHASPLPMLELDGRSSNSERPPRVLRAHLSPISFQVVVGISMTVSRSADGFDTPSAKRKLSIVTPRASASMMSSSRMRSIFSPIWPPRRGTRDQRQRNRALICSTRCLIRSSQESLFAPRKPKTRALARPFTRLPIGGRPRSSR
ncbi:hypothetical protein EXIGLDRAFT_317928 [Exidia glandulosa HHB12029]|uniref:Uncharacterized protein n=1 Tax=Exidia glandulosa HHB12029 TaxID=1314781 RepID=A0A165Q1R0_EXIGL|nr:hypothetical protein EXIGLDRAFT_317928 [Exidia glandulosa HHB12029]